LGFFKLLLK
jgi:hypothetical protein